MIKSQNQKFGKEKSEKTTTKSKYQFEREIGVYVLINTKHKNYFT